MKDTVLEKNKIYRVFNDIALKDAIVVFGSSYTARFPFYEVSQKYYLDNAIYNRSIEGLTIDEAEEILDSCVIEIEPSKVFLSLGECDEKNEKNIKAYERILLKLKKHLPKTELYVLSVEGSDEFNKKLKIICNKTGSEFININYSGSCTSIFKQLSLFFRKGKIDFCDAFKIS